MLPVEKLEIINDLSGLSTFCRNYSWVKLQKTKQTLCNHYQMIWPHIICISRLYDFLPNVLNCEPSQLTPNIGLVGGHFAAVSCPEPMKLTLAESVCKKIARVKFQNRTVAYPGAGGGGLVPKL